LLIVAPPTRAPTFTHFPYTTLFRSTNGKIMHTERFIATIFAAQFCEAGFAVRGHILQPLRHFLWSASAQVAVDVGFRTKDFYQVEKLVGTYSVIFQYTTPVGIHAHHTLIAWANAIAPVIFVRKAAAWPTQ